MGNVFDDRKKSDPLAKGPAPAEEGADRKGALRGQSFDDGAKALAPEGGKAAGGGVIAAAKGDVRVKLPRSQEWTEVGPGARIPAQGQVSTEEGASVTIKFDDGSDLSLGSNSLLVIYGGSSRTAKTRERTKTQVLMREGTVKGGLAALDQKKAHTPE